MISALKRQAKDLGMCAVVIVLVLFFLALIFGSVAFEALKFFALVKYLFS